MNDYIIENKSQPIWSYKSEWRALKRKKRPKQKRVFLTMTERLRDLVLKKSWFLCIWTLFGTIKLRYFIIFCNFRVKWFFNWNSEKKQKSSKNYTIPIWPIIKVYYFQKIRSPVSFNNIGGSLNVYDFLWFSHSLKIPREIFQPNTKWENKIQTGREDSTSKRSTRSSLLRLGTKNINIIYNLFCVETFSSFFAYFNKLYFTTSFIFILTFSSEKSDTGTKFINRYKTTITSR